MNVLLNRDRQLGRAQDCARHNEAGMMRYVINVAWKAMRNCFDAEQAIARRLMLGAGAWIKSVPAMLSMPLTQNPPSGLQFKDKNKLVPI
jgi:hypothetical protein